jgi:hypothetical protein
MIVSRMLSDGALIAAVVAGSASAVGNPVAADQVPAAAGRSLFTNSQ